MVNFDVGNRTLHLQRSPLLSWSDLCMRTRYLPTLKQLTPENAIPRPINILRHLVLNRYEPADDRVHKENGQRLACTDQEPPLPTMSAKTISGYSKPISLRMIHYRSNSIEGLPRWLRLASCTTDSCPSLRQWRRPNRSLGHIHEDSQRCMNVAILSQ